MSQQAIIKFESNKFFAYTMDSNGFILSDSRVPNCKSRLKKLGYTAILDDSVYDSPDAPKRAVHSHISNGIIKKDTMIECNKITLSVQKSVFTCTEKFGIMADMVGLICRGILPSMVCIGKGGIGKSHTIIETLNALGMVENTIGSTEFDFTVISGYMTPYQVYKKLYELNGGILVFDDTDKTLKDEVAINILKAALDSKEHRIISWGSKQTELDGIPDRFEFIGKVIFISNLTMDKIPQPMISRSMLMDLTLTDTETLERIETIFLSDTDYQDEKIEVMAWIKSNYLNFKDLNIRSAFNALKMRLSCGDNWERMALYSASVNS